MENEKELSSGTRPSRADRVLNNSVDEKLASPTKKETITVDKEDFELIMNRLEKLEAKNSLKKAKVIGKDTVTIAFYDGRPVIGFGAWSKTLDPMGEPITWLELKLKGVSEMVKVDFAKMDQLLERREATVVSKDVEPIVDELIDKRTGEVLEVERKEVRGYTQRSLGYTVPMVVESTKSTYHVSFEDGTVLTVSEDMVNI